MKPLDTITSHLLTVSEDEKEESAKSAPIIINHDDLIREQLCEMGRFLNLENIVCEARTP